MNLRSNPKLSVLVLACLGAACTRADIPHVEWIGSYSDGLFDAGHSIELAQDGSFSYERCAGMFCLESRHCRGDAFARERAIELRFVSGDADALEPEYVNLVPLKWSGRHYLFSHEELLELYNDWNAYRRPHFPFLERKGDPGTAFETAPQEHAWAKVWEGELDLGSASGAFAGMKLHAVEPKSRGELVIVELGEHASLARWGTYEHFQPAPESHWTFSTRP
jgi:hypothetical protein